MFLAKFRFQNNGCQNDLQITAKALESSGTKMGEGKVQTKLCKITLY